MTTITTMIFIEILHVHTYSNEHYVIKHDALDNHESISWRMNIVPRITASCRDENNFSECAGIFFM